MTELQTKVEALLLKKNITKENNEDYDKIVSNCLEAIDDKLPDIIKEELDSLKVNKGELKNGWTVKLDPGSKKLFEVTEATPSGCVLVNIADETDKTPRISVRTPVIIVDKGDDEDAT